MRTVSAKELRGNLPKLLAQIEKGREFVIIYRSRPVGCLGPLKTRKKDRNFSPTLYDLLKKPHGELKLSRVSAVDLIRADRAHDFDD